MFLVSVKGLRIDTLLHDLTRTPHGILFPFLSFSYFFFSEEYPWVSCIQNGFSKN